jgi:hypothetical protein
MAHITLSTGNILVYGKGGVGGTSVAANLLWTDVGPGTFIEPLETNDGFALTGTLAGVSVVIKQ